MNWEVELDKRLVNWSFYVIDKNCGYPTKATIADFGTSDSYVRQSKPPFPINNLQADELNCWINIMGKSYPQCRAILKSYYLRRNGERLPELAKANKVTLTTFKQRLHDAKMWLIGRLTREV